MRPNLNNNTAIMIRSSLLSLLTLALLAGCTSGNQSSSNEEITKSVENMLSDYQEHLRSGNIDRLMSLYSKDPAFHWVEDGKITYQSAEEVRNGFRGLLQAYPNAELELSNIIITPLPPDYASISAGFTQSLADSSGNGFSFSGAMTLIAIKEEGSWRFLNGHTSSVKERQ